MRDTGSYSPERMLTLQLASRSESTRTSHSLPCQIAFVGMRRVYHSPQRGTACAAPGGRRPDFCATAPECA